MKELNKPKKPRVYLAGKIWTPNEREMLENIDKLCKSLGLQTFLPHRDVGFATSIKDADKIFRGDIKEGFKSCSLIIASLDGLHVGAGTAWELGYAYAKGIPSIGIKTDETAEEAFEYLSSILIASMPIVTSLSALKAEIKKVLKIKSTMRHCGSSRILYS